MIGRKSAKDTIQLLKNTFTLIGKNHAILQPMYRQGMWVFVLIFCFILLAMLFVLGMIIDMDALIITSIILFALIVLFCIFGMPFVMTYYRAAQTWIVYMTIKV